jgi:hypothetical protein
VLDRCYKVSFAELNRMINIMRPIVANIHDADYILNLWIECTTDLHVLYHVLRTLMPEGYPVDDEQLPSPLHPERPRADQHSSSFTSAGNTSAGHPVPSVWLGTGAWAGAAAATLQAGPSAASRNHHHVGVVSANPSASAALPPRGRAQTSSSAFNPAAPRTEASAAAASAAQTLVASNARQLAPQAASITLPARQHGGGDYAVSSACTEYFNYQPLQDARALTESTVMDSTVFASQPGVAGAKGRASQPPPQ